MNQDTKKEMIKTIDIAKQAAKNNMEVTMECFSEIISKLDMLTYMVMQTDKK